MRLRAPQEIDTRERNLVAGNTQGKPRHHVVRAGSRSVLRSDPQPGNQKKGYQGAGAGPVAIDADSRRKCRAGSEQQASNDFGRRMSSDRHAGYAYQDGKRHTGAESQPECSARPRSQDERTHDRVSRGGEHGVPRNPREVERRPAQTPSDEGHLGQRRHEGSSRDRGKPSHRDERKPLLEPKAKAGQEHDRQNDLRLAQSRDVAPEHTW